jgi:hypothetical protein
MGSGITAAVGVVAADRNVALVIEQPVKDMQGFACGRCDHFRVERGIAIGEVRVEFAPGIIAVMGVDAAGIAAEAAGPEKLAVRGRGKPAAEYRRQRLALLVVDATPQGQGIGSRRECASRLPKRAARGWRSRKLPPCTSD